MGLYEQTRSESLLSFETRRKEQSQSQAGTACVCVLVKLTTTVVTMLEPGVLGTNCALGFCFQEAFQWLRKWARLNKADLSNITSDTILGYPRG